VIRQIYLLPFLFFSINCLGQKPELTKRNLLKVLKSSIRQNSKSKIQTNSNPWTICNKDSSYYKSDTLHLYLSNNSQYRNHSSCCDFIDWTFYKKDAFILTKTQICKEPPTTSSSKADDWYKLKILKENGILLLIIFNQNRLITKFKVINIDPYIILVKQSLE